MNIWQMFKSGNNSQFKRPINKSSMAKLQQVASVSSVSTHNDRGDKFSGFEENRVSTPFIEFLPDEQLQELNRILDWNCFTVDSQGRRFGKAHSSKKRQIPQEIPDGRIILMNEKFNLANKTVLEVGCFEGVHTTALSVFAKNVIALDSRIENVVKTMVRLGFFARKATVLCCDLENLDPRAKEHIKADLAHHVGVLYHLKDPVSHIFALRELAPEGIMLDTHFATPEMATKSYVVNGETYRYFHYKEKGGYAGVFSGMYDHAKWLHVDDLQKALRQAGYSEIEIIEKRDERNGPRILLFARPTDLSGR